VAAPPRLRERQAVLVAPLRHSVEQLEGAGEDIGPARVGRIGVVDDAFLESEGAEPVRLMPGSSTRWKLYSAPFACWSSVKETPKSKAGP
jgi:hypothetical protein